MNLMRVKGGHGCLLTWPIALEAGERVRGLPGYVVDMDMPLEKEWCAGQMHKLEPAPEGSVPTEIVNRSAQKAMKAAGVDTAKRPAPAPVAAPASQAAATDEELRVDPRKRAKVAS